MFIIVNKKTRQPLGVTVSSNEGSDFCNDVSGTFDMSPSGAVYCVDERRYAEKALADNTPWYNASIEVPAWPCKFYPEEWEIIELDLTKLI